MLRDVKASGCQGSNSSTLAVQKGARRAVEAAGPSILKAARAESASEASRSDGAGGIGSGHI